ncbi:uncharacterized protein LOC110268504 [Arachis ipaensis]|uniref:uncharacterized protein LOC110268504 n=1 Tax=Arachis ipaensis TaxID=130454 RepID=UPI000A2B30D7|nr:uncharacterized protein LOC110268504 [Arachis ipaensis]
MHARWLSKVFLNKIAENPKIKLTTLMRKAYTKWNVELTKSKASRVRQFALDELQGTYVEQYRRLYDYCHELLRTNPGSSVHLKVQRPPEFASERPVSGVDLRPRFERIYVMLDACRRSFMACRPIIGLDGYFLKTPYGGWLLTAMGWDPNDQILPIAYAVVEAETKDLWTWFLQHLCDDLGADKIRTCTFMSDQQKGLVPTFEELLPGVDHRFCVRHLYANFKKRYTGLQLKLMMWNAAKATYLQEWERRMSEIQKVDQGAYNYLMEIPTKYWCRHRFECKPRCDTLVNNMCEVFNSVMVEAREKPIVTMLEDIRVYIMKRCADNRDRIVPYNRDVLPRIRIKVEKQAELSGQWVSVYAGRDRYEVVSIQGGKEKFVVDLRHHECSCRKFQLSGIPCAHAMTCIRKMCFNVDSYVADYYKKAAYISCYQHVVYPVNGPNLWDRTQFEDVLPPTYRKPIGRPKKKRARGADEQATRTGLSREGQQQKCSYCLCSGHNKRSCPKKRKVTPNPTVNNVATSTSKGRKRQGVRKSSRLSAKTDSGKAADSGSRKQRGSNNKPPSHPKRKPPVSSQQSQAASKRAKVNHSQTASAPAPTTTRVLPSPVKRVTQSQLRFMARTPPRAWKKVE